MPHRVSGIPPRGPHRELKLNSMVSADALRAISLFLPINMAHLHTGAARMRGAIIERNRLPGPSRMGVCGLKVSKFPWTS
jgi:hypothetical protein